MRSRREAGRRIILSGYPLSIVSNLGNDNIKWQVEELYTTEQLKAWLVTYALFFTQLYKNSWVFLNWLLYSVDCIFKNELTSISWMKIIDRLNTYFDIFNDTTIIYSSNSDKLNIIDLLSCEKINVDSFEELEIIINNKKRWR